MTILSNTEIRSRSRNQGLITPFHQSGLGGASYELRCSSTYYDLTEGGVKIDAKPYGNKIIIKPKHTIVIITEESLKIPSDLTAHIISKGSLFSIGLSPVSTYADPGFTGQLGLVTTNTSEKYIVLDTEQSVAKIHFTQLSSNSTVAYTGQHGYQTRLWPIRTDLQKIHAEVKNDKRVKTEEAEATAILPMHITLALKNIRAQNTKILAAIAVAFLLNALLFYNIAKNNNIEVISNIAINLISSVITGWIAIANTRSKL